MIDIREKNTYGSRLGHGKYINHSHCIIVNKLSQHQTHNFHWYTCTAVLQHLMVKNNMTNHKHYWSQKEPFKH